VVGDSFIKEIEVRTSIIMTRYGNSLVDYQNQKHIAYNVRWASGGVTMRGTFTPGCGNIKSNTLAIRRLLFDEGARRVERNDWKQVLDDDVRLASMEE
jgi:hypothetical protein